MNTEQKPLQQRILDAMSRDSYRPLKRRKLATLLGMIADQRDYAQFKLTLGQLVSQGLVVKKRGNKYELAERANTLVGLLTVRGTNYGFVNPQGRSGIVEIRRGDFGTAMHGDIVEVEITQVAGPETAAQGKVVNITRAGKRRTVGTAVKTRFGMFFIPIRGGVFPEVPIDAVKGKKLKHGELVTVEFIRERYDTYRASVVERLGHASEYSSTIEAILRAFEIPGAFPSEVSREAKNAAQKPVDEKGRKDYRELVTVTIDPDDAKDFDDAISIEQLKNGGTRLYVHIADVADVVPRGSVLDEESRRRATSVYLPGFVVPMLPHHISNERCCLRPQEDRPAKTVVLDYDASGNRTNYSVHRSMIHSNERLNYKQALQVLEGSSTDICKTDGMEHMLRAAWSLAEKLRAKRMDKGSLMLDMPDTKVRLDDAGVPLSLELETGDDAHSLIEECMLEANKAVAELLLSKGIPGIFRVHEEPEADVMHNLMEVLDSFGVKVGRELRRADLTEIINDVRGKPFERIVNLAILRTMKIATYSHECAPHYALAFEKYLHFTSPIRRYPDLFVHQQLDIHYFKAAADVDEDEAIDDIALNCSNRERNAEECERDLVQLKTLEYLAKFKGKEFEAVITGIKDFGIIVELNRFLVDGLIHVRNIGEEFFVAAGNGTRMSGERGTVFKPGQPVKVVIVDVDLPRRRLEMRLRGFNDSDEAHGLYNVEGAQRTRSRKKRKGSKASGRMKSRSAGKSRRASSKAGSKNNRRKRRK